MKKNIIELCLLHLLSVEKMHGYEILKKLSDVFPDTQESAIYAMIRELKKNGYIEQYAEEIVGGPPRKYYLLTESGKELLANLKEKWNDLIRALSMLGIS